MSKEVRKRYPGAQPFNDDGLSRSLFYGREKESTALTNQILANRLVVLCARSGLGKTSLLNAGVSENLRSEGFLPLPVRVNDTKSGPLESVYSGIKAACERQGIEYKEGDKSSLWYFFKTAEFWQSDLLISPVLILDQFEEMFALQSEQQRIKFLDQFSYLVRGVRPKELPAEVSDSPPPIKIVISLREDFLANLEELSDRIPEVLDQRFRLLALERPAASQAIEKPASIEDPNLATKPFELDSRARDTILNFLESRVVSPARRSSNLVEPFQLQLICQHVEGIARKKQVNKAEGRVRVTLEDVGGESNLRRILKVFYTRQVSTVRSLRQRKAVKRLCSEFLISPEGRRLRMEESEIQRLVKVRSNTLQKLVDCRLLRVEQSADGNYFELSHDSLIRPVIDSKRLEFALRAVLVALLCVGFVITVLLIAGGESWSGKTGQVHKWLNCSTMKPRRNIV